jgi:hypothetical protein
MLSRKKRPQVHLTEGKRNGEIDQIVSVHRNALADSLERSTLRPTRRQRVILERIGTKSS